MPYGLSPNVLERTTVGSCLQVLESSTRVARTVVALNLNPRTKGTTGVQPVAHLSLAVRLISKLTTMMTISTTILMMSSNDDDEFSN